MYLDYWGLAESPFSGPADPYWFIETPVHEEALARLSFLADNPPRRGLLAGPSGTGKSLVLETLCARRSRRALRISAAGRDGLELCWELAAALGLAPRDDAPERWLWRRIGEHIEGLRLAGESLLVLFDDADRATADGQRAIERLFAETGIHEGRLSIVLTVRDGSLRRLSATLRERCDLRIDVPPLEREETADFVRSLTAHAGADRELFDEAALRAIHDCTGGVPGRIRRLCDLALLAGMSESLDIVDAELVAAAALEFELQSDEFPGERRPRREVDAGHDALPWAVAAESARPV